MNKIKFNLRNTHYAPMAVSSEGVVSFETPVRIPGAVSLAMEAQGEISKFHADGIVYYQASANNGYDGDLEAALVPESFLINILGEKLDSKKILIEKADAKQSPFALLFEFDGDEKAIRHVLYNCSATRPSMESSTKEETIEPVTETLKISAVPLENGLIKAKTSAEADKVTYDNWYKAVYISSDDEGEATI